MFIYFEPSREGWVLSRTMLNADDHNCIAWFPVPPNFGNMPERMHMPFWQKKPSKLVRL